MQESTLPFNHDNFDEIDFYLGNVAKSFIPNSTVSARYRYATLIGNSNPKNKILAAEELAITKSINISTLFDTYRSNRINGSKDFWSRMIAIKNLDLTLKRNNEQAVGIALDRVIKEMYKGNLLFTLASEYSSKLESFSIRKGYNDLNDSFAIVFALNGDIPPKWIDYQSKDKYIAMAFKILKNNTINLTTVSNTIRLVHPSFRHWKHLNKSKENQLHSAKGTIKIKGKLILEALRKSSEGVNTQTHDLQDALLTLLNENQPTLVKSILIEYLINYSRIRA